MRTPEKRIQRFIYDYVICDTRETLIMALHDINLNGYSLVSVSQDSADRYTIVFRRPLNG